MRSLKSHDVDSVGSDGDEDNTHDIEVEGSPMVLEYHVGVASGKDYEVDLLCFVADSNDVFIGQDFE